MNTEQGQVGRYRASGPYRDSSPYHLRSSRLPMGIHPIFLRDIHVSVQSCGRTGQ